MVEYSTNPLNQAGWLVYINGIEVPAMGVTANWGVWQMPTATVQLVPHPMLQRIGYEDRLQVAIFYLDQWWFADDPQFCLLGEFEVVGWSYANTPRGRAMQLECVGHEQILEQLHFFYMSSLNDIASAEALPENYSGAKILQTKLLFPYCLFTEGLTTPIDLPTDAGSQGQADQGFIKRPVDFVLNVFRAILGEVNTDSAQPFITDKPNTIPPGFATAPGKNFFARWFKMTKFHQRWCALPLLEDQKDNACFPLLKAVQDTQTMNALQMGLGSNIGDSGTAWSLLQYIFGTMYMEVAMIPSPPAAIVEKTTGVIQPSEKYVPKKNQFRGILSNFVKPQCVFSLPPMCNVIFPSMIDNFTFRETYITQPTRLYLSEDWISSYIDKNRNQAITDITKGILTTGYPASIRQRILDTSATEQEGNKSCLLFPEEFFKGPVAARLNGPPWMYMLYNNLQAKASAQFQQEVKDGAQVVEVEEPPLSEQAKAAGASADAGWMDTVIAAVANTDTGAAIINAVASGIDSAKAEEKQKKVIIKEGTVDNAVGVVTKLVQGQEGELLGTIFNAYAEYEYYRSRYAERQGGVNMQFNPYIIPGFPAVVFDQLSGGGFHCTGYVKSLSHTFNASGAIGTTVNLSYMRTIPEFLGILGDTTSYSSDLDISPIEPIAEVSNTFQKLGNAHSFYRRLLFKNLPVKQATVFNWRTMLNFTTAYGNSKIDLDPVVLKKKGLPDVNNIDVVPKKKYLPMFNSYAVAMSHVSRPVCTLREYIEAYHEQDIDTLLNNGTVRGVYRSFYSPMRDSSKKVKSGAAFWGRIYTLIQGPGPQPGVDVLNMGPAPTYAKAGPGKLKIVDRSTGTPETRQNWDKVLLEYRKIVRSEAGDIAPQK